MNIDEGVAISESIAASIDATQQTSKNLKESYVRYGVEGRSPLTLCH
jgi:hypothetical protein